MLSTLKTHWLLSLSALGLVAWWFFTGDDPLMIFQALVGRGSRLTTHHQDDNGDGVEDLQDLIGQAVGAVGHTVSEDAYVLASVSSSEHGNAGQKEKALIQRIVINYADSKGVSILRAATGGKGLGTQPGRYCSTANGIFEDDLRIAEANLAGQLADDSAGSLHWVHKTGFASLGDYQRVCDKWRAEMGIVPLDVGGVSSLRIFLPASQVENV